MARTAFNAPGHRVLQRWPLGALGSPPNAAPNVDFFGSITQDERLPYNYANSSTAGQVVGIISDGPMIDQVPSTIATATIAALQVPVAGTPLTLVSSSGGGITVSSSATLMLPSLTSIPTGNLFIDGVPSFIRFGTSDITAVYDPTTAIARTIQVTSAGNDSGATLAILGWDIYGYVVHETLTLANIGVATSKKALKAIHSLTPAGTLSGANVSVGQSDVYGLPIQCRRASMLSGAWNNISLLGVGTFTTADTAVATATTGDVRGTYTVASASDGTKRLTLFVAADYGLLQSQGTPRGLWGRTQF